jgi:hypothetical protein
VELWFHFPSQNYTRLILSRLWKLRSSSRLTSTAAIVLRQISSKGPELPGLDGQVQLCSVPKEAVQCLEPSSQFLDVSNLSVLLCGTAPRIAFPDFLPSLASFDGCRKAAVFSFSRKSALPLSVWQDSFRDGWNEVAAVDASSVGRISSKVL